MAAPPPRRGGTINIILSSEPPTLTGIANTGVQFTSPKVNEGLLTLDFDLNPAAAAGDQLDDQSQWPQIYLRPAAGGQMA